MISKSQNNFEDKDFDIEVEKIKDFKKLLTNTYPESKHIQGILIVLSLMKIPLKKGYHDYLYVKKSYDQIIFLVCQTLQDTLSTLLYISKFRQAK